MQEETSSWQCHGPQNLVEQAKRPQAMNRDRTVELHREGGVEAATIELVEAAVLSPLAAPGSLPEVYVVEANGPRLRLRMRVYVFDRTYEERYRSDILARLAAAPPATTAAPRSALAPSDPYDPHA